MDCPICYELMPKCVVMPCGHSVCCNCINSVNLRCPACRAPFESINNVKPNYMYNDLAEKKLLYDSRSASSTNIAFGTSYLSTNTAVGSAHYLPNTLYKSAATITRLEAKYEELVDIAVQQQMHVDEVTGLIKNTLDYRHFNFNYDIRHLNSIYTTRYMRNNHPQIYKLIDYRKQELMIVIIKLISFYEDKIDQAMTYVDIIR